MHKISGSSAFGSVKRCKRQCFRYLFQAKQQVLLNAFLKPFTISALLSKRTSLPQSHKFRDYGPSNRNCPGKARATIAMLANKAFKHPCLVECTASVVPLLLPLTKPAAEAEDPVTTVDSGILAETWPMSMCPRYELWGFMPSLMELV